MSLANVLLPQPDLPIIAVTFARRGNHQGKVFQQVYSARMVEGDIDTDNIAIVGKYKPRVCPHRLGFRGEASMISPRRCMAVLARANSSINRMTVPTNPVT